MWAVLVTFSSTTTTYYTQHFFFHFLALWLLQALFLWLSRHRPVWLTEFMIVEFQNSYIYLCIHIQVLYTYVGLLWSKLVLRTISRDQFANLLHKDKEHLELRNNFRMTKKFLIAKFDCTWQISRLPTYHRYSHT